MEPTHRGDTLRRPRPRHTPAERRQILAEFKRSGLSQEKFAVTAGISAWTLCNWLSGRHDKETPRELASERVAVQVFDPAPSRAVFELAFGSKVTLRVPAGFDEGELRRLVAILRDPC